MDRKLVFMISLSLDLDRALVTAKNAAWKAGGIMNEYRGKTFRIEHKGDIDLVTEVDYACENVIIEMIQTEYPNHDILTEERDEALTGASCVWIIDPLDGTTNFAHGFPVYCVSVALMCGGVTVVGAIYDPSRNEMFSAVKGKGAFVNDAPMHVSMSEKLVDSLLATGFPYSIKTEPVNNLSQFGKMSMLAQAIRRPGAAALDLAYTACGRLDGFWEFHLNAWDMAAGALMVEEAGGMVTCGDGNKLDLFKKDIVATNAKIHGDMLEVLRLG